MTAKAVSACLLGKVFKLGEGHRKAAKRRMSGSSMRMREEKLLMCLVGVFIDQGNL